MKRVTDLGVTLPIFEVGGSRVLFMISTFYAFADLPVHLKTLRYEAEDCEEPKTALDIYRLFLTLWPLKLLAGRVKIEVSSLSEEWVKGLTLNVNDLDPNAVRACRQFAESYFSHQEPHVGNRASLESVKSERFKSKLQALRDFDGPVTPETVGGFVRGLLVSAEWRAAFWLPVDAYDL